MLVAPPNRHLLINGDGSLSLTQTKLVHFVRPSADLLFESVAAGYRERAIAVVLSGSGSDGSMGVRAIKKMGGTVIAQDEETSEYYGMPGAAVHTGCVDFILPLDEIAPGADDAGPVGRRRMSKAEEKPGNDPEFEALLDYIHRSRGFDFTGYKRPSLMRRVNKRMQEVGIREYGNYVDYMEVHPEEFRALFDTILINVTAFFRDASAWELLSQEIIPRILASKTEGSPIRVWCAGCASGEEAYSLAMVLAEALGVDAFRDRVKIYATDVDEEALIKARQAIYDAKELQNVSPDAGREVLRAGQPPLRLPQGAAPLGDLRAARPDPGRSDLADRPADLPQHPDVLQHRDPGADPRPVPLRPERGRRAVPGQVGDAADLQQQRLRPDRPEAADLRAGVAGRATATGWWRCPGWAREEPVNHIVNHFRLCDAAFESGVTAQLVVEFRGLLALANERARAMFDLILERPRPPLQGPPDLLPPGRPPLVHRPRLRRAPGRDPQRSRMEGDRR